MADPIPAADLPSVSPGAFDSVVGVDESTGAARRFPVAQMPASAAVEARLSAVEDGQDAGMIGFATKAAMDADLAHAEGTLALVTNDGTLANNGTYRKSGASGAGSWVQSEDRVTSMLSRFGPIEYETAGPVAPVASGLEAANKNNYFWPSSQRTVDRFLTGVQMGVFTAGSFNLLVAQNNGDGTLSLVSSTPISFTSTGAQEVTGLHIEVPAGCIVGYQNNTGRTYYTSGTIPNGEATWYVSGPNTIGANAAYTSATTNGSNVRFVLGGEISEKSRAAYTSVGDLEGVVGSERVEGWPSLVSTGTDIPNNYTIISKVPAPNDCTLTGIEIGADNAATANVYVLEVNTSTLEVTIISTTQITVASGVNTIPLSVPVAVGQYVGIGATAAGAYKFQNSSNPEGIAVWIKSGSVLASGDTVANNVLHAYEVSWQFKNGLLASMSAAHARPAGLGELDEADATGVADATAEFTAARAAHPFPYVPPGVFSATAIPAKGDGFWGPGRVSVNADRFFIPSNPTQGNLQSRLRAAMLEHIVSGDVLTLISDSIGHFAAAGSGAAHWFDRLTKFANLGICADEPTMTALRPSSTYTPPFYGVTVTGGSTGTRGPLGESLILASGDSISFTGIYEQVDVFYTQDTGAGSLAFAFNGAAAYKTVNAAGALTLDVFSGPSMTGQAGSGTYTITATGGAVELTGLLRLGTKAAATGTNGSYRLRTARASHGSYTFASFNAPRMTSIIAQAAYAGGKIVPIIALGINDSFGTAPATIVTNATAVINALNAAGVARIYAIPPFRPTSSWNGSYTGGRTYDAAMSELRKLYRQEGVRVIELDGLDWSGQGLLSDGLHPNALGHDRYAQLVIEGLAS